MILVNLNLSALVIVLLLQFHDSDSRLMQCQKNQVIQVPSADMTKGHQFTKLDDWMHIFPHLTIECDGILNEWRILTKNPLITGLYLGIFRWSNWEKKAVKLINVTAIENLDVPSADDHHGKWISFSTSMPVKADDFIGFYYKVIRMPMEQRSLLIGPSRDMSKQPAIVVQRSAKDVCLNNCPIDFTDENLLFYEPALSAHFTVSGTGSNIVNDDISPNAKQPNSVAAISVKESTQLPFQYLRQEVDEATPKTPRSTVEPVTIQFLKAEDFEESRATVTPANIHWQFTTAANNFGASVDRMCQVKPRGRGCRRTKFGIYFNSSLNTCQMVLGCPPPPDVVPFLNIYDCVGRCEMGSQPVTVAYYPFQFFNDKVDRETANFKPIVPNPPRFPGNIPVQGDVLMPVESRVVQIAVPERRRIIPLASLLPSSPRPPPGRMPPPPGRMPLPGRMPSEGRLPGPSRFPPETRPPQPAMIPLPEMAPPQQPVISLSAKGQAPPLIPLTAVGQPPARIPVQPRLPQQQPAPQPAMIPFPEMMPQPAMISLPQEAAQPPMIPLPDVEPPPGMLPLPGSIPSVHASAGQMQAPLAFVSSETARRRASDYIPNNNNNANNQFTGFSSWFANVFGNWFGQ